MQIDLLAEISQSPRILSEVDAALKAKQMKADVEEYLKVGFFLIFIISLVFGFFSFIVSISLQIQYQKILHTDNCFSFSVSLFFFVSFLVYIICISFVVFSGIFILRVKYLSPNY